MNVQQKTVSLSLETLLLELGLTAREGIVYTRSSGFGTDGNTMGSVISLTNLTLLGYEAVVIRVEKENNNSNNQYSNGYA